MRRLLPAVSLACAIAVVVLSVQWWISHHRIRGWRWVTGPTVTWLWTIGDGHVDLRLTRRAPIDHDQGHWAFVSPDGPKGFRLPGVALGRTIMNRWTFHPGEAAVGVPSPPSRMTFDSAVWDVRVDFWLPTVLLALPPAAWADRWRRRRRIARARAAHVCVTCGYDLRATPGRCPECGQDAAPC